MSSQAIRISFLCILLNIILKNQTVLQANKGATIPGGSRKIYSPSLNNLFCSLYKK